MEIDNWKLEIKSVDLLRETKQLCKLYHIAPVHSRGQNFLVNEDVYQAVIAAADLKKTDTVLEVGPGLGFLTFLLAQRVKQVVAVELDKKLAAVLDTRLKMQEINNVSVVNENILDWRNSDFKIQGSFKIVANLPYNITAIFLRKFLTEAQPPLSMTLMLQKEVAERLVAGPSALSLLGLSVQFYAVVEVVSRVPKNNFWPVPQVDSAIVHLRLKKQLPLPVAEHQAFFRLLKIGFSAKRKMLKKNLVGGWKLPSATVEKYLQAADLPLNCRAQDLGLEDWLKLFNLVKNF